MLVLVAEGDRWIPVEVRGRVGHVGGISGCTSDGIWTGRPGAGTVLAFATGTATASALVALPTVLEDGETVGVHPLLGSKDAVAVVQGSMSPEEPDRPRAARAFILEGGSWHEVPSADVGPGSSPFLNGTSVAVVDFKPGPDELEVVFA